MYNMGQIVVICPLYIATLWLQASETALSGHKQPSVMHAGG